MNNEIDNTGAQFMARALRQHGVRRVFGLCGDHINALYRALTLEDIEIVSTRSESAAVHMADAYARVTRSLGVAVVTGCPGHTNALTGMSVAMNAQSPVLVISGLTPVDQRDRGGSQVLHQADLARPVTKWALEVPSAVHMAEMVTKAIQIATSGTPGPVSLSVPSDVFEDTVQKAKDDPLDHLRQVTARAPLAVRTSLSADGLAQVRQLLQGASRPVLILGNGARRDGSAEQANAIVQKLGIPVFTIDQARGLVPDDGRHCFGYADPLFSRTFRETVAADVVVLAGPPSTSIPASAVDSCCVPA
ncbi:thiamine pyrophosphate-binding protein [Ottowia sp.]|uniref:thiamine pyrophosphate-binding protein n=1 Tax=Ottowia sp. TaxID=1898956 RepID=UPI0025F1C680|nr:thiamine pyrophosphate-binding protein [Ottowia sp.]MBK6616750.1 thiamine pyrophosphate-binding protein [Ottowia sp.]